MASLDDDGMTGLTIVSTYEAQPGTTVPIDPVRLTALRFDGGVFIDGDAPDSGWLPFTSDREVWRDLAPVPEGSTFTIFRNGRRHLYVWTDDHWQRVRVKDGMPIRG